MKMTISPTVTLTRPATHSNDGRARLTGSHRALIHLRALSSSALVTSQRGASSSTGDEGDDADIRAEVAIDSCSAESIEPGLRATVSRTGWERAVAAVFVATAGDQLYDAKRRRAELDTRTHGRLFARRRGEIGRSEL